MRRDFVLAWLGIIAGIAAFAAWISFGGIYFRRKYFAVPPILEASRVESEFVAILLPRIVVRPHQHAMSSAALAEFLGRLQSAGYVSISMNDVAQLYWRRRGLPPKSVLIAFAQDDPQGMGAADEVMKDLRLRGVAFLDPADASSSKDQRRRLSPHAVSQMRLGGSWEFGWTRQEGAQVVLGAESFPLRFTSSELGLNDGKADPHALNLLAIRPGLGAAENYGIVANSWRRTADFSDDFAGNGLGTDWVAGWGVVARGNRRLTILPTPRQSSAGVFLRGTEKWRDLYLEFQLKRYQKEFWAYARYKSDGSFLRVGARNGYWYVEQKIGPKNLPSRLARSPIQEGSLPAQVRLVLKGDSAIIHVNDRLQFGRVLRVNPAIDEGRVLLGVYDARSRSALAVLTSVKAGPLGDEWISFRRDAGTRFDENRLEALREEAVRARAMSPLWVDVASDGKVSVAETDGQLIRSMAGFYGCRLMPMAEFPEHGVAALESPGGVDRLAGDLADSTGILYAAGLNLRLRGDQAKRPETLALLTKLQAVLHIRRRELWVTVDRADGLESAIGQSVDGILKASPKTMLGIEVLEALQRRPPMQRAAGDQMALR
jgi:hypothetical protein